MQTRVKLWGMHEQRQHPELHTRVWRAASMYEAGMRPERINGTYIVPSQHRGGTYMISYGECDCPDTAPGGRCKHKLLVNLDWFIRTQC